MRYLIMAIAQVLLAPQPAANGAKDVPPESLASHERLSPVSRSSGEAQEWGGRAGSPNIGYEMSVTSVLLFPVVTHHGRYVGDLQRDDLIVLEQGKPVKIDSLEREVASLHVVLLLDTSESMTAVLGQLQDAASGFVDLLGPGDLVSVIGFSHTLTLGPIATLDHAASKAAIHSLSSGGGTALFGAVRFVTTRVPPAAERTALIVFSDGADKSSTLRDPQMASIPAAEKGLIVYTVLLADPAGGFSALPRSRGRRGSAASDGAAQRAMWVLADTTGGEALNVGRAESLPSAFGRILADLHAQYRLSYTPPDGPACAREVKVRSRDARYRVRCRKRYVFGQSPTPRPAD